MKTILLTGAAGFIGSNIVETLLKKKVNKVVVLDNLSTGYKKNIDPLPIYSENRLRAITLKIAFVEIPNPVDLNLLNHPLLLCFYLQG